MFLAIGALVPAVIAQGLGPLAGAFIPHMVTVAVGFGVLAWAILPSQPRNATVWTLAVSAFLGAIGASGATIGFFLARASQPGLTIDAMMKLSPSELPLPAAIAVAPQGWLWLPAFFLVVTVGLQLFPDGKVLAPRWRPLLWTTIGLLVAISVLLAIETNPWSTVPLGDAAENSPTIAGQILGQLYVPLVAVGLLSIASLVFRYRQGSHEMRQQIRWVALGGLGFLVGVVTASEDNLWFLLLAEAALVAAFVIAITRYKVYTVDIVISKVVTYGSLAVLIGLLYATAVFSAIVVLGDAEQKATGNLGVALPLGATLLVALLFEPLRQRMQRLANRLVYGRRAAPAEVLSELAAQLDDATLGGDLAGLAALIREGTAAEEAIVWLRVGEGLRAEASSPPDAVPKGSRIDDVSELPESETDLSMAVAHAGDELGALQIVKSRAHAVTSADRVLLADVAAAAGLLMRNLRLNAELADRARLLQQSRRRLIAAQDAVRHRLERNLHDGAQQEVVALKVKLGLAKALAGREGLDEVIAHLDSLAVETDVAVDQMRRIARGIYPPLLEAEGLTTALTAAQRTFEAPVEIVAPDIRRHPRDVEEAVYFGVLGAVSAALVAGASRVRVEVSDQGRAVSFVVSSDAPQEPDFTALVDRIEALGGVLGDVDHPGRRELTAVVPSASVTSRKVPR